jgi:hypothetical protein
MIEQQSCNAGSDGSHADDRHVSFFHPVPLIGIARISFFTQLRILYLNGLGQLGSEFLQKQHPKPME